MQQEGGFWRKCFKENKQGGVFIRHQVCGVSLRSTSKKSENSDPSKVSRVCIFKGNTHNVSQKIRRHLYCYLEEERATPSSVPAWETPRTGEMGGLQSMGSQRVGHDWSDLACMHACFGEGTGNPLQYSCTVRWSVHAQSRDQCMRAT